MDYHQFTITIPTRYRNALEKRLLELGSLGFSEQDSAVTAYFPRSINGDAVLKELLIIRALLVGTDDPVAMDIVHSRLPDADWNESWKKSFKPMDAGERFTILPPWEPHRGNRIPLVIDPGMAFGTGHHETTRSCIALMEQYAAAVVRDRFLDLGTGTGLLAIAALTLGFRTVVGIDNDPLAIEAARKNLALNHSENVELHEGDLSSAEGTYDMIAANLISGTLIELAGGISGRLRPGGVAILSGVLKGQDDEVVAAMERAALGCLERLRDGKWVSIACRR